MNNVILLFNYYRRYIEHVATLRNAAHAQRYCTGFQLYCKLTIYVYIMWGELNSSSDRNERRVKDRKYFKRFQHYGTAFVRGFNIRIRGIKIPRMDSSYQTLSKTSWKSQVSNSYVLLGCQCYISLKSILYRSPIMLVNI